MSSKILHTVQAKVNRTSLDDRAFSKTMLLVGQRWGTLVVGSGKGCPV